MFVQLHSCTAVQLHNVLLL